jgi:hypothetical protein
MPVQSSRHALKELIDDHAGGAPNHTLSDAGNGTTRTDIAGIPEQCACILGSQLDGSVSLYKAGGAAAIHRHLVFGSGEKTVQADGPTENAADRSDAKTHLHIVCIVTGLYELFAARQAFGDAIRICEKSPNGQRRDAVKCELPGYFHMRTTIRRNGPVLC